LQVPPPLECRWQGDPGGAQGDPGGVQGGTGGGSTQKVLEIVWFCTKIVPIRYKYNNY